jgi:hypothetical protein
MSKRFGRNQRRQIREELGELEAIVHELAGCVIEQESRALAAEHRIARAENERNNALLRMQMLQRNAITFDVGVDQMVEDLTYKISVEAAHGGKVEMRSIKMEQRDLVEQLRRPENFPRVVKAIAEGLAYALTGDPAPNPSLALFNRMR